MSTEPFDLVRTQMGNFLFSSTNVSITGSVITVDETAFIDDLGSGGLPNCSSETVPVGPVSAGTYTVNWTTRIRPGVTDESTSFQVTISNPPSVVRRRAARH